MLNYLLVLLADFGYSTSFALQNLYQKKEGNTIASGLLYNMIVGAVATVLMLVVCGFAPQFTPFSLGISIIQTALLTAYTMIGFYILKKGGMAFYTMFLMSGGMLVPYVWGVMFLDEELTLLRSIGVIAITIAVIMTNYGKTKTTKTVLALCVLVFFINGLTGVFAKIHQIEKVYATIGEFDLVFWSALFKFAVCAVGYFIMKNKSTHGTKLKSASSFTAVVFASLATTMAEFINLVSASKLPASVLYPMITGGTIIISSLFGAVFFKEKLSKTQLASIILCFAGTCMFI